MNDFAPGALRQAWLAGQYDLEPPCCPGCGAKGGLGLLQPGKPTTVPGLEDRPDYWGCVSCGWTGFDLAPTLEREINDCWNEQARMQVERKGGGGCRGRRNPKPGEKRQSVRVEQDGLGAPDRTTTTTRIEYRSVNRSMRLTPSCDALIRREMEAQGCTFQALADRAWQLWALEVLELAR